MPDTDANVGDSLLEELPPLTVWSQKQSHLLCQSLSSVTDSVLLMPDIAGSRHSGKMDEVFWHTNSETDH